MKILLLYSWNDLTSQNRFEILQSSEELKKFSIKQCFILNRPDDKINQTKFQKKLCSTIKSFQPQVLLVHAGIVFHRYPLVVIETLRKVVINYPELRIGIEHQPSLTPYYSGYKIFDNSDDMTKLQNLFFRTVFKKAK